MTTPNAGSTFAASVTVASVVYGTVPITNPVREQGLFIANAWKIGIPIPLEAKDAAGSVIPGLTTAVLPTAGAGPFPSGVTVTDNDASGHTKIYLIDAATGAIAQGPGTSVTIHEFNILQSGAIPCTVGSSGCVGGFIPSDTTAGGAAGDPWIIMLTSDGVDASLLSTVTVTASATIANAALPTPITLTISPQSTVYSAGGTGYADAAAPAAPLSLLQPVAAGAVYFTDGNKVKIDGTATVSAATGTTLTGLSYAAGPAQLYAVDNASVGTVNTAPSGLYDFVPATLVATPVVTQDGNNNAVQFKAPVASVYAADTSGNSKLFVVDGNGIEIVDINQANQTATNVGPLLCNSSLAAAPTGVKLFGTVAVGTASSTFLVADPGNARIAQVAVSSNFNCTVTTYASGAAFTGLTSAGGAALYATSTTGQIYYISGSGATPVSLGVATAAAGSTADGPIGQLSALGSAPTGTLTPVGYLTQFVAHSFFDTVGPTTGLAAPYTLAPFNGTTAVAAQPAPIAGFADTSTPSGVGKINATGGIILVPAGGAASAVVTPDSLLFVDSAGTVNAKLRTLVR